MVLGCFVSMPVDACFDLSVLTSPAFLTSSAFLILTSPALFTSSAFPAELPILSFAISSLPDEVAPALCLDIIDERSSSSSKSPTISSALCIACALKAARRFSYSDILLSITDFLSIKNVCLFAYLFV